MVMATLAARLAPLRQPMRAARIAAALWVVWAVIVWNVVFDQVIVRAGRRYLAAAVLAAHAGGPYARIDDWMRPAVAAGLWIASAAAGTILILGLILGWFGVRTSGARAASRPPGHEGSRIDADQVVTPRF
jgi:hypothetical protein